MRKNRTKSKTPIGMILLAIFLIWIFLKSLLNSLIRQTSLDMNLLAHYNLLGVSQFAFIPLLILNALSIYVIFSRKRWGPRILISFFVLISIITIFIYFLSIYDLDLFRELSIQSRTERGLHTEAIDSIANPVVLGITSLGFVIFFLLLAYYVYTKRRYFDK